MKICFIVVLFLAVILLEGCQTADSIESPILVRPPNDQLVWVSHLYVGGRQCDPSDSYRPPDVSVLLCKAGIAVFDMKVELYGVCAACGCPSYAAMHYALIEKNDLTKAGELGFQKKDPPE